MSKSYKKAILKDGFRNQKKASIYWRPIRSKINQITRQLKNDVELEIPNPKTIINDYTYSDYTINYEYVINNPMAKIKHSRK